MVAAKVTSASCTPVTWSQSTLRNILSSELVVEMEPWVDESFTQDALLVTVKVKGEGPPAPTST